MCSKRLSCFVNDTNIVFSVVVVVVAVVMVAVVVVVVGVVVVVVVAVFVVVGVVRSSLDLVFLQITWMYSDT